MKPIGFLTSLFRTFLNRHSAMEPEKSIETIMEDD